MDEPVVVNIMADGRVCTGLAAYLETHPLPETARRVLEELVSAGRDAAATGEGEGKHG